MSSGKTLVERWQAYVEGEASRDSTAGDGRVEAAEMCIDELMDACTPRPPDPSWFGAPFDAEGRATGKWDCWELFATDGAMRTDRPSKHEPNHPLIWKETRKVGKRWVEVEHGRVFIGYGMAFRELNEIAGVLPVLREGYGPAGWHVVEGEKS